MLVKKSRKMKYNNKRKNLRKNTRYFSKKKSRKSKSRKLKSRKLKSRKSKSKKLKQIKGGYGKGSCPFVDSSKFIPLSKNGVAPGGVPVYAGNQNGGNSFSDYVPQYMLNGLRLVSSSGNNLVNSYKGQELDPSPLPMHNQLKKAHLEARGL